jgi:hypothetical protein
VVVTRVLSTTRSLPRRSLSQFAAVRVGPIVPRCVVDRADGVGTGGGENTQDELDEPCTKVLDAIRSFSRCTRLLMRLY